MMHISEKISYKIRNNLISTTQSNWSQSLLKYILRPDLPGRIVGTICKHPSMNVSTFNAEFFAPLLKNLNKENKEVILTGDFNVNLLNFGKKRGTHQFLEELFHNNYTPQITLPTRITDRSATLTDNIFLNTQCHKQTSGNITTSLSDHLPQFTILEKFLGTRNIIGKEQITYCDFKNFNEIEFIGDIQSMDWSYATQNNNADLGFEIFLCLFNKCLDKQTPLKTVSKKGERVLQKPWITNGIKTSIKVRDKL